MKRIVNALLIVIATAGVVSAQTAKRGLSLDDLARLKDVRDPQCAPDGKSVAFVVSQIDVKDDKPGSAHIWTVGMDGRNERQLTSSNDSESSPRFSPDGRYLSFMSSRPGAAKGNQVWLLDRNGGEASQLTSVKGRLQGYEWSPDSKRLALVVGDPDPDAPDPSTGPGQGPAKAPKPIVIDRYKFKQDVQGYLLSGRHTYVYLFDIATKTFDRLTKSAADEASPAWSPDGTRIAFMSNRHSDPDRDPSSQLFVVQAKKESVEKALTPETSQGGRGKPEWSPDGKWIALLDGDDKKFGAYGMEHLALVASEGSGTPLRVAASEALDRGVSQPRWSEDGTSIFAIVTDDMSAYGVRIPIGLGNASVITEKPIVLGPRHSAGSCAVAISGDDSHASEIYSASGAAGKLKFQQLSHQNDALFAELQLGTTREVSAKSKDGSEVHGLLTTPPGYVGGTKIPMLLRIHGGPNGQDQHSFAFERQWFAANGYAVLAVNYRGSAGRGAKYSRAIFADWGHYEVDDLQAMVDEVVKMGVADPNKLGVGGWSYGGILTDYMIASDTRFKAATSGAGTAFTVSFYGTDQYIIQYDYEIGPPWNPKAWETYQKLSYPFLHADRIKTPTLFLGGERDFNVPVQGGQQMYQALRSLGIDTQLVIYPNEFHGITRPSYVRDRYERYLAWYDRYIKDKKPATSTSAPPAQIASAAPSTAAATFNHDVAPVLFKSCVSCHRPGESTPMSLTTYKDARPWARAIRAAVTARIMPPWGADPAIGSFSNDPSLSAAEVATIVAWADNGAPEGDAADLPALPAFADGWKIGKPDLVVAMAAPAEIPAAGPRIIKDYPLQPVTFAEDTYVERMEIVPGNRTVTHHAIVSVVDASGSRRIGGFQPGGMITDYPVGVVRMISKGASLNLNMHYNPKGMAATDTTTIAFAYARGPVQKVAITGISSTRALDIPPGDANYEAKGNPFVFAEDSHIVGLLPRMNERGKDYRYTLVYPDGRSVVLLSVPKFNDDWQPTYVLKTPIAAPKGSRLETVAHYDNSSANRHNPDPTARVPFGPEIMNGYVDYTIDSQDLAHTTLAVRDR